jgi:hypothetical protein
LQDRKKSVCAWGGGGGGGERERKPTEVGHSQVGMENPCVASSCSVCCGLLQYVLQFVAVHVAV